MPDYKRDRNISYGSNLRIKYWKLVKPALSGIHCDTIYIATLDFLSRLCCNLLHPWISLSNNIPKLHKHTVSRQVCKHYHSKKQGRFNSVTHAKAVIKQIETVDFRTKKMSDTILVLQNFIVHKWPQPLMKVVFNFRLCVWGTVGYRVPVRSSNIELRSQC